ncbi:MAG: molybdate ABC transporter substrate-binding protein [Candidatus Omnitrophica bacterium]|nr:molybdate ABC transporter substrate-binding protein [Candidatus Omnitrophota bacterium]MDE2008648.1 molybdate ABC transporter substrate-binding protein [Candidatus Omnitrophota bacterium]MDE2214969.1 molybdate ABC transporter substrate-binding protein [Candidatus Omnitrophota bacterium]MDE2230908.1 molybdate ABC transporter substrate-binding protein [Candidatus Omnitrophota bacterium]
MKMMKKLLIVGLFLGFLPMPARAAGGITVAAAANLQFTLDDLKAQFTRETGIDVKTVIASSGKLTSQIANGAPFDVFLSADMKYPEAVFKEGLSLRPPKVYAYGVLVLWTMRNEDLSKGLGGLGEAGVKKIALADPRLAPYGRQAVNAMKYAHLYPGIIPKLVYGESIAQTNEFITTGAADVGFTAESIVLSPNMKGKGRWVEVDPRSYKPIAQGAVVLKYAPHAPEAKKFYDFLFSAPARATFKKYGYSLPK